MPKYAHKLSTSTCMLSSRTLVSEQTLITITKIPTLVEPAFSVTCGGATPNLMQPTGTLHNLKSVTKQGILQHGTYNMSKRQQIKNEALLRELSELPENRRCADCGARNPGWASWNLGIFLCIRCAGIHRKMGTHISKVKSLSVDAWTTDQIYSMKQMGNKKSNSIWDPHNERSRYLGSYDGDDDSVVERYIRDKYERGKFRRDMEEFIQERAAAYDHEYSSSSRPGNPSSSRWFRKGKKNQDGDDYADPYESRRSQRNRHDDIYHINERRDRAKSTFEYDDDYEYEDKIYKLLDMGFSDRKRNLEALNKSKGDLLTAIELLTNGGESDRRPVLPRRPGNSEPLSSETSEAPSGNTAIPQQAQYTGAPFETVYDQFGNAIGPLPLPIQQFQPPPGPPPQFTQQTGVPMPTQQQRLQPQSTGVPQNFLPPPYPPPGFQNPLFTGAPQPLNPDPAASQRFQSLGAVPQKAPQLAPQATGYNPTLPTANGLGPIPTNFAAGTSYLQSQTQSQQQQQQQQQQPQLQYNSSYFSPQPPTTQNNAIQPTITSQLQEAQASPQKYQHQSTDLLADLGNAQKPNPPLTSAFQNLSLQSSQPLSAQTLASNPPLGQQSQQQLPSQGQFLPAPQQRLQQPEQQQHQQQPQPVMVNPLLSQPTGVPRPQETGFPQLPQSSTSFLSAQSGQGASIQPQPPASQPPQLAGFYQYQTSTSATQQPPVATTLPQQQPLIPQLTQQPTQVQQQPPAFQQPMPTGYGPRLNKSSILSLYSHPDYYSSPVGIPVGGVPAAPPNNPLIGDTSSALANGNAQHQEESPALKPGNRNPFLAKQQPSAQPQQPSRDVPAQRKSVRFDDFNSGRVSPDAFGQLSALTGGSGAKRW
ncbi:hypothetical protein V1525DRAFT_375308 [Lipomyces kononenkoae]|uniref:Uncharacterized protein n=1 Tax=Lipomyces kononenkoae TaxID=34357 RepID=A0ACC3T2Y0_LIPKO